MARATNYLENAVLNAVFGKTTFPSVTGQYLGLFTASPTDSGTLANEFADANSYARVRVDNIVYTATSGEIRNTTDILFNQASGGDWATAHWIGVLNTDTLGTGQMYLYGSLNQPVFIGQNDQFRINASNFAFTCD